MILSYPTPLYVPTSIDVHSSILQNANKVDEFNYRLSRDLFIGTYDNIEVTPVFGKIEIEQKGAKM